MTYLRILVGIALLAGLILLIVAGVIAGSTGLATLIQLDTEASTVTLVAGVVITAFLMLLVYGLASRRGVPLAQRRGRQAEVYAFLLDTLAAVLHLPPPDALADAPEEVQDAVADVQATLQAAERQLQLHGGRRVLREYRALREAAARGEIPTKLLTNLLVEMRRDLGLSVYSELRAEPLGFDRVDGAVRQRSVPPPAPPPAGEEPAPGGDGTGSRSRSNVIASSFHRS